MSAREGVERIEDSRAADRIAYEARLAAVEAISSDVRAIRQGQLDAQTYNAQQFSDLRREVEHVRGNAAMARDMVMRGRGQSGEKP